jgi:hypothetical protein
MGNYIAADDVRIALQALEARVAKLEAAERARNAPPDPKRSPNAESKTATD